MLTLFFLVLKPQTKNKLHGDQADLRLRIQLFLYKMHHHKSKRIKKDGRYYYEPWNPFDMDVSLDPDGANWTELAKEHDLELLNDAIILYPTLKMKKKKAHAVL